MTRVELEICKKAGWDVIVLVSSKPFQKI